MDSAPLLPCPGCGSQQFPHSNKCPPLPPEVDHADYLAIDDLLDFSNEDIGGLFESCISNATSEAKFSEVSSVISSIDSRKPAAELDFNELCPPCDELAELEWLSNFVEESFSSAGDDSANRLMPFGSFAAVGNGNVVLDHDRFKTTSPVSVLETNPFPRDKLCSPFSSSMESCGSVPGRARSKRRRTAACFWNTHILSSAASESLLGSSNEYTTRNMATASSQSSVLTYYEDEGDESDEGDDPRALHDQRGNHKKGNKHLFKERSPFKLYYKKPKKFKVEDAPTTVRKCLHCGMQKTPQWRAGPMGPKTLCNACGVRYKSGRLCDEYRPAASPTFNENVHSNSHRKVMEMRRQMGEKASKGSHEQVHRLHVGSNGGLCPNKKARLSSEESD